MAIHHLYSKRKQEMKATEWIERRVWWFYDNNQNRQINGESFAFTYLSNSQINEFLFLYCVDGLNMQSLFDQQRNKKLLMLLKAHLRGIQLKMNYTKCGEMRIQKNTQQITNWIIRFVSKEASKWECRERESIDLNVFQLFAIYYYRTKHTIIIWL